jgi:hypothetical protein
LKNKLKSGAHTPLQRLLPFLFFSFFSWLAEWGQIGLIFPLACKKYSGHCLPRENELVSSYFCYLLGKSRQFKCLFFFFFFHCVVSWLMLVGCCELWTAAGLTCVLIFGFHGISKFIYVGCRSFSAHGNAKRQVCGKKSKLCDVGASLIFNKRHLCPLVPSRSLCHAQLLKERIVALLCMDENVSCYYS